MRCFRVVAVLDGYPYFTAGYSCFTDCFTVHGALKRPHKGEKFRSLRAALQNAAEWADAGWHARVVRRTSNGWVLAD